MHFITPSVRRTINNLILNLWSHHNACLLLCGYMYCKCWPIDKSTKKYKLQKKIKTNLITKPDHVWGSHHLHLYFNSGCSSHWDWTWFHIWTMMLCGNAAIMCRFHKTANPNHLLTYSSRSLTLNRKCARMPFPLNIQSCNVDRYTQYPGAWLQSFVLRQIKKRLFQTFMNPRSLNANTWQKHIL